MLKCNHLALNNLHDLLCRYCRILNWEDLCIKLRYLLEKRISIENKNTILIFYIAFFDNQEGGNSDPNITCNRHENTCQKSWRIHQNIWKFSNNLLPRIMLYAKSNPDNSLFSAVVSFIYTFIHNLPSVTALFHNSSFMVILSSVKTYEYLVFHSRIYSFPDSVFHSRVLLSNLY